MVFTIITSIILVVMALILGAFAWKMRQQEQDVLQYQRNQMQDQDLISELRSRLNASRVLVEELEFQLHLKDSDIRIASSETATERRNKQEAQQLLEIHRMQDYVSADSTAMLLLAKNAVRGNAIDFWTYCG